MLTTKGLGTILVDNALVNYQLRLNIYNNNHRFLDIRDYLDSSSQCINQKMESLEIRYLVKDDSCLVKGVLESCFIMCSDLFSLP